jgi:hypothetical protein
MGCQEVQHHSLPLGCLTMDLAVRNITVVSTDMPKREHWFEIYTHTQNKLAPWYSLSWNKAFYD